MAKIKLNVENLHVESFDTLQSGEERGTIVAHAELTAPVEDKSNADTCARSCADGGSCYVTWCVEVCWYTIDRERE